MVASPTVQPGKTGQWPAAVEERIEFARYEGREHAVVQGERPPELRQALLHDRAKLAVDAPPESTVQDMRASRRAQWQESGRLPGTWMIGVRPSRDRPETRIPAAAVRQRWRTSVNSTEAWASMDPEEQSFQLLTPGRRTATGRDDGTWTGTVRPWAGPWATRGTAL